MKKSHNNLPLFFFFNERSTITQKRFFFFTKFTKLTKTLQQNKKLWMQQTVDGRQAEGNRRRALTGGKQKQIVDDLLEH